MARKPRQTPRKKTIKTRKQGGILSKIKLPRSKYTKHFIIIGVIMVIGVIIIALSRAANGIGAFEIESGSKSANNVVNVSDNSASAGSYVQFNSPPTQPTNPSEPTNPPVTSGKKCNLNLHGATRATSWSGWDTYYDGSTVVGYNIWPQSPNPSSGHWLYDGPQPKNNVPIDQQRDERYYQDNRNHLEKTLNDNDCGPTILFGQSNGASFAAKLMCRGEDFGGRLWAVFAEDPVTDVAVVGCNPSKNITATFFTYSREFYDRYRGVSKNGENCSRNSQWWNPYCEDDLMLSVDTYKEHLGRDMVMTAERHDGSGRIVPNSGQLGVHKTLWNRCFMKECTNVLEKLY